MYRQRPTCCWETGEWAHASAWRPWRRATLTITPQDSGRELGSPGVLWCTGVRYPEGFPTMSIRSNTDTSHPWDGHYCTVHIDTIRQPASRFYLPLVISQQQCHQAPFPHHPMTNSPLQTPIRFPGILVQTETAVLAPFSSQNGTKSAKLMTRIVFVYNCPASNMAECGAPLTSRMTFDPTTWRPP